MDHPGVIIVCRGGDLADIGPDDKTLEFPVIDAELGTAPGILPSLLIAPESLLPNTSATRRTITYFIAKPTRCSITRDSPANLGHYYDCGAIKFAIADYLPKEFYYESDNNEQTGGVALREREFSAIHCGFPGLAGESIISVFAIPKRPSPGWPALVHAMGRNLRDQGISVHIAPGPLGEELLCDYGQYLVRVIGIAGDRYAVRATLYIPMTHREDEAQWMKNTRDMLAHSLVMRGDEPRPAYSTLPLLIPADATISLLVSTGNNPPPSKESPSRNIVPTDSIRESTEREYTLTGKYDQGHSTLGGVSAYL